MRLLTLAMAALAARSVQAFGDINKNEKRDHDVTTTAAATTTSTSSTIPTHTIAVGAVSLTIYSTVESILT